MDAGYILAQAADTFKQRNAQYKHNADKVGKVMQILFPDGVQLKSAEDFHKWHLFELMIVKLTRFVNSDLNHYDSIRDLVVYGAMVEAILHNQEEE